MSKRFDQIIFIAAMKEEADAIKRVIPTAPEKCIRVIQCGVGKVNAASSLASWFDVIAKQQSLIINIGSAGSLDPSVKVGDMVVSNATLQHDVDVTALGFFPTDIPFNDKSVWVADQGLVKQTAKICSKHSRTHIGIIVTGDQFIANANRRQKLREDNQALCVDMEGAAIAATSEKLDTPWIIIRAISDNADGTSPKNFVPNAQKLEALFGSIAVNLIKAFLVRNDQEST